MSESEIIYLHGQIVNLKMLIFAAKQDGNNHKVQILQQMLDNLINQREALINYERNKGTRQTTSME
jgi:mannitol/fructose-specific phosphotransferase system IIA component (Ntr-type)